MKVIIREDLPMPNTSWRTTVSAFVSTAGDILVSFVLFCMIAYPQIHIPLWIVVIAMFAKGGGLAALGITAKDSQVTGGLHPQPSSITAIQYKVDEHAEAAQVLAGAQPVPVVVKPTVDMNAPLPPPLPPPKKL